MFIENISILADNIEISNECLEKIRNLSQAAKKVSKTQDINIKIIQNSESYEGLLWGKLDRNPIGAFNRGHSLPLVLENLNKRVKRECLKILQEKVRLQNLDYLEVEHNNTASVA